MSRQNTKGERKGERKRQSFLSKERSRPEVDIIKVGIMGSHMVIAYKKYIAKVNLFFGPNPDRIGVLNKKNHICLPNKANFFVRLS
jgi:hypothetical protein